MGQAPSRPAAPPPRSPEPQSLPAKSTGQVQWYDSGSWVLEHEPPLRQGPEAQGSRAAGDPRKGGACLRARPVFLFPLWAAPPGLLRAHCLKLRLLGSCHLPTLLSPARWASGTPKARAPQGSTAPHALESPWAPRPGLFPGGCRARPNHQGAPWPRQWPRPSCGPPGGRPCLGWGVSSTPPGLQWNRPRRPLPHPWQDSHPRSALTPPRSPPPLPSPPLICVQTPDPWAPTWALPGGGGLHAVAPSPVPVIVVSRGTPGVTCAVTWGSRPDTCPSRPGPVQGAPLTAPGLPVCHPFARYTCCVPGPGWGREGSAGKGHQGGHWGWGWGPTTSCGRCPPKCRSGSCGRRNGRGTCRAARPR